MIRKFKYLIKMTAKELLYKIKDQHNIGSAWQLTEHIIIEAMEKYSKQQLKKSSLDIILKDRLKFSRLVEWMNENNMLNPDKGLIDYEVSEMFLETDAYKRFDEKSSKNKKSDENRFVSIKHLLSLMRQRDKIDDEISSYNFHHCKYCGDTKPKHGFYPLLGIISGNIINETSGLTCNRCVMTDKEYEETFGEPKEIIPNQNER